MDPTQLITIVQEYQELYNLKHPFYSNQQRRDNIWQEIGERLNKSDNACKERWTRIRDNHRKALNLRKTKSGQAASKMRPPKYSQELSFLTPYLSDEEERRTNLSSRPKSANNNDETQLVSPPDLSNLDNNNISSDAQSEQSIQASRSKQNTRRKLSFATSQASQGPSTSSQGPSTASVLQDYLNRTRNQSDPLLDFFINMAKTVKAFPLADQVHIKAEIFKMVNSVEMRLATTPVNRVFNPMTSNSNVRVVSNVMDSPAPTGSNSMFLQSAPSAAPAMNKMRPPTPSNYTINTDGSLHILPLELSTVCSQSSTFNERPTSHLSSETMSPPDTSQSILEEQNDLGQYLRFK